MAIALSGSLILSGSITVSGSIISTGTISMSGSIASASYAANADTLDGLDSTVFTLTSSFAAQTASFTAFTSSINSFSASVLTFTGSAATRLGALETYTSSLNNKTSSFATTGSNTFIGTQVVSGSVLQSGSFTSTGTLTAQTLVVQTITSSVVYSSGSNIFGNAIGNTQTFTGSVNITGSLSGTSATFNHNDAPTVNIQRNGGTDSNTVIQFTNSSRSFFIGSNGTVMGLGGTAGSVATQPLQIDSTGVATFSSNIIFGASHFIGDNAFYSLLIQSSAGENILLDSQDDILLQTNATTKLTIKNGGNVGIGVAVPVGKLDISTGGNTNIVISNDSVDTGYNIISLNGTRTKGSYVGLAGGGTGDSNLYLNSAGGVIVQTGASYTQRLTITSTGTVLVNATTSTYGAASGYMLGVKGTSSQSFISIARTGQSLDSQGMILGLDTAAGQLTIIDNLPLTFATNNAERMRITSGGNVGIGISPINKFTVNTGTNNNLDVFDNGTGIGIQSINNANTAYRPFAILGSTLSFTGAATFSSSVTATGYTFTGTGAVIQSNGSVGNVPQYGLFYNSGGVFYFGKDDGSGGSFGVGAYASVLWNSGAYPIVFATSGAERMRITSGGNVLIGTTTDLGYKFQVNGKMVAVNDAISSYNSTNTTAYGFYNNGSGSLLLENAGVGYFGNFVLSTGVYTATSDINKKKDFELSTLGLNAILGLKPTLYRMKDEDNTDKHLGFIAQEVKEFIPQAFVDNDGFIGLDYQAITATLVKAIQELKAEFDEYKTTHP